jgi:hypothetical protein
MLRHGRIKSEKSHSSGWLFFRLDFLHLLHVHLLHVHLLHVHLLHVPLLTVRLQAAGLPTLPLLPVRYGIPHRNPHSGATADPQWRPDPPRIWGYTGSGPRWMPTRQTVQTCRT